MKKKIISALLVVMLILPTIAFTGCTSKVSETYVTPENTEPLYVFDKNVETHIREDVYTPKKNNALNTPVEGEDAEAPVELKQTVFKLVQENANYKFFFSEDYLEIALQDKKTGDFWYSNPTPSERSAGILGDMSSQLTLFYFDKSDNSQKTLESYSDCVNYADPEKGKYQHYVVNHNGNLRVIYIIGKIKPEYAIPTCMNGEMAEDLATRFKENGYAAIAPYITTGSLYAKITPETWKSYTPDAQEEYLKVAPLMGDFIDKGETVYIIKDQTKKNNERLMLRIEQAFVDVAGMDLEKRDAIDQEFGFKAESAKNFWIPLDYVLTENGLQVTIPNEEIQYDKENLALSSIDVLKYFGSASEKEDGYMFVPDGSGTIVNFNNGKTNITTDVRVQLYGIDDGRELSTKPFANEDASLPVFGIKRNTSALFAIIESGDHYATVIADIAGKNLNSVDRNRCFTRYKMIEYEDLQFKSAGKTSRIYQEYMNADDISILYTLLDTEKASYNGMAEYYRNYLIDKGVISKKSFENVPFNIELVGAYDHETAFLGVGYTEMKAITTFSQCKDIIKQVSDAGIKNVSINYKGWANNGLRNTVYNKAKVIKELGGKQGLLDLLNYAESIGVKLYLETELAFVYDSAMFDGYSEFSHASRLVTREVAYHYQYVNDWNTPSDINKASIVSPTKIYDITAEDNSKSFATKLYNDLTKLNVKSVSLGSLGYNLPGNYKIKDFSDRAKVADTYSAVAKKYSETFNVMAKGTNSYMLPYVDSIFEISNTSSKFNLSDASVPFYQMVIHGCIEYSGAPINLDGDTRQAFLQAVEAGAGTYYRWCYASNDEVQDLWFEGMYSLSYSAWIDDAIKMYKEYNDLMGSVAGQFMVEHEIVAENVSKVTYENGVSIYVNYNNYDYTAEDGTIVKAESFAKGGVK